MIKENPSKSVLWRNVISFWFFGLCNNFAYVVMLSAADDILTEQSGDNGNSTEDKNDKNSSDSRNCNQISTGTVLLADILPCLILSLFAPFIVQKFPYGLKVAFSILMQCLAYLVVGFSVAIEMSLFGVVCASIAQGFGEITFLSLSSHFDKNAISTWSSGTGGAGIFGSLAYAGLTQSGISPRHTVLIMLVIPAIMIICYWFVLVIPPTVHQMKLNRFKTAAVEPTDKPIDTTKDHRVKQTFKQKLKLILPLLKFIVPLALVYMFEYFINQGLQELVFIHDIWLTQADQYRWFQVLYQIGVFISRSSVNLFRIPPKLLFILPLLQLGNTFVFFTEALWSYIPSIWVLFVLILIEGLLGGAAYVNSLFHIRQTVSEDHTEFSLSVPLAGNSLGIVISAFAAIPTHNWICSQPLPKNHY